MHIRSNIQAHLPRLVTVAYFGKPLPDLNATCAVGKLIKVFSLTGTVFDFIFFLSDRQVAHTTRSLSLVGLKPFEYLTHYSILSVIKLARLDNRVTSILMPLLDWAKTCSIVAPNHMVEL